MVAASSFWENAVQVVSDVDPLTILSELRPVPAVLTLVCVFAGILNRGAMHQAAHGMIGLRRGLLPITILAGAAQGVNKLVKSGGTAGLAVFLRRSSGTKASVVAAYAAVSVANAMALAVLMMGAIPASRAAGLGTPAMALSGLVVVGSISVAVVVAVNWRRKSNGLPICPRLGTRVLGHGLIDKAIGATGLAFAAQACGASIGLSGIIVAYSAALGVASAGPLPSGIGVVEAAMAAVLVSLGMPIPAAAATVFVFRLVDLWIPLAVGAVFMFFLPKKLEPDSHGDGEPLIPIVPVVAELLHQPLPIPAVVPVVTTPQRSERAAALP